MIDISNKKDTIGYNKNREITKIRCKCNFIN